MNCYSCDGYILKPVKLEAGLPARECNKCGGLHINLLSYRAWRDDNAYLEDDHKVDELSSTEEVSATDNKKALVCHKCSKIMLKYKISSKHENYVDVCGTCDDAWLDGGEWALLAHLHLQEKLTHILTEPWQRNLKQQFAEDNFQERYLRLLGAEDLQKVIDISAWISEHPKQADILKFIRRKTSE